MSLKQARVALIDCVHATPSSVASGYPYIAIPQMTGGRIDFDDARQISAEDFATWTRKARPRKHDIVLSRRTNPGVVAPVSDKADFALGQNLVLLRADGSHVSPEFLRWLTTSPQWWGQIDKFINVGAIFNSLRCADVPNFVLPIPPLADQRAIAAVLSALDDKIELDRRMNETLEASARALFRDWFVDFGPTRAKAEGHPAYLAPDLWSLFPDRLGDDGVPDGWAIGTVRDHLELKYGKSLPARDRVDGPFPVYGSGGISGTHNKKIADAPAVIVGRKGTVGSLYWEDSDCYPIDTVFFVSPMISMSFSYELLASLPLADMNTDAAVPGLNRENVYRLEVPRPPADVIRHFDAIVGDVRAHMRVNDQESRTLAATRDALLPKLMSGELRVQDAEALAA